MKRLICLLLAFCLLFSLSACAAPEPEADAPAQKPGRWVEEEVDVPLPPGAHSFSLQIHEKTWDAVYYDASDFITGWSRSRDCGQSWEMVEMPFWKNIKELFFFPYCDFKVSEDGLLWFLIYDSLREEVWRAEDLPSLQHSLLQDSKFTLLGGEDASYIEKTGDFFCFFGYWDPADAAPVLLPADRFFFQFDSSAPGDYTRDFFPLNDKTCLIVNGNDSTDYFNVVDTQGQTTDSFEISAPLKNKYTPHSFLNVSSQAALFQTSDGRVILSDLSEGASSFLSFKNAQCFGLSADQGVYGMSNQSIEYIAPGGTLAEELFTGENYFFRGGQNHINMIIPSENDLFSVMNNSRLFRYHYDAEAVLPPPESMSVFSMHDNPLVRQTIAQLRLKQPELTVVYRIGDEELAGGMTKQDLITALNTELLVGEGPDVLILDDIGSLDSYVESGIFTDLTEVIDLSALFSRIVDTARYENAVYAVPGSVLAPMVLSLDRDVVAGMDGVPPEDRLDPNQPDRFPSYSTLEELLRLSEMQSARTDAYQQLSLEKDSEIYKIHLLPSVLSPECFEVLYTAALPDFEDPAEAPQAIQAFLKAVSWMDGSRPLGGQINLLDPVLTKIIGHLSNLRQLGPLPSLSGKKAFLPRTIAAIPIKTASKDNAIEFIRTMLSEPVQFTVYSSPAFSNPFNMQRMRGFFRLSADDMFTLYPTDNGFYSSAYQEGGLPVRKSCLENTAYAHYGADKDAFSKLYDIVESLDSPVFPDPARAQTFYEITCSYLNGSLSLDEAANTIMKAYSREDTLSALEREK
ncbi:MAG: hypothetical protein Q4G07_01005 [Oscillospiraceae bacterium]|nr:hypothetical protein [Oscillospiraceae bacterium]